MHVDKMQVEITGLTPMILHNGRTASPLDPFAKQLKSMTSKRNKSEDDIEALLELQWEASLYWNDEMGLYMPSENLFAAFLKGAKKYKLGPKCSAISFPDPIGYPILTKGAKSFDSLRKDRRNRFDKIVVIQKSKTNARRAIFHEWGLNFTLEFEPEIIDANEVKTILLCMAQRVGLGVWVPSSPKPGTYGKFAIKSIKWTNSKTKETKVLEGLQAS